MTEISIEKLKYVLNRKDAVLPIIDTSAVCEPGFFNFMKQTILPAKKDTQMLFVSVSTLLELRKLSQSDNYEKKQNAKKALIQLNSDEFRRHICIIGKKTDDPFTDPILVSTMVKYIGKAHILVISEDVKLLNTVLNTYKDLVCVDHKRSLSTICPTKNTMVTLYESRSDANNTAAPHIPAKTPPVQKATVHVPTAPSTAPNLRLHFPSPTLRTADGISVTLACPIGSGLHSRVFTTNDDTHVAKIINPSTSMDDYRDFMERVEALIALRFYHHNLVIPNSILYHHLPNGEKVAVGYLMMKVDGITLHKCLNKNNLTLKEGLSICSQLATAISFLKLNGITVPDLRTDNVMLTKDHKVKLIDADGWNIPGHAKEDVFNALFDPPRDVDIDTTSWRLALITANILFGHHPFLISGKSIRNAIDSHCEPKLDHEIMSQLSDELCAAYKDTFIHHHPPKLSDWERLFTDTQKRKTFFAKFFG